MLPLSPSMASSTFRLADRRGSGSRMTGPRPLCGVRVLSMEQYGAGPFASMQLADLGAEVIKIEDPTMGGDTARYVPPYQQGWSSLFFESFNRGKKSIALDLRRPGARQVLEDLVAQSDALLSNLRGSQPARLRIAYRDLAAINPKIVCCSLSGFGQTGPRADQGAYDYVIQAMAGWMSLTGGPDEPPTKSGLSLVDLSGGYVAAIALLAGLWKAEQTGLGCDCDVSLFETALSELAYVGTWASSRNYVPPRLADSAHPSVVPFQAFRASDAWIVIACVKNKFWEALCEVIGQPDLAHDLAFSNLVTRNENRSALVAKLKEIFLGDTADNWIERLVAHGVPAGRVNTVAEALEDPQSAARGVVQELSHRTLGNVHHLTSPFRIDGNRVLAEHAPELGRDSAALLRELCGYDDARLAELVEQGAIAVS